MQIINQSRVNYEYQEGEQQPIIKVTEWSNRVVTLVLDKRIQIEKKVDKVSASLYEILLYTFTIQNISQLAIHNIFFEDALSSTLRFICNSVCVNGFKRRCASPVQGFKIGTLEANESLILSFRVVIQSQPVDQAIVNFAVITYDYLHHMTLPPIRVRVQSNGVMTQIKPHLFKQWTHEMYLEVPYGCLGIDQVQNGKASIKHIEGKVLVTSLHTQVLVIGQITYELIYRHETETKMRSCISTEGFSCLVQVPDSIRYCDLQPISVVVEDTEAWLMGADKIALSAQLLIQLD